MWNDYSQNRKPLLTNWFLRKSGKRLKRTPIKRIKRPKGLVTKYFLFNKSRITTSIDNRSAAELVSPTSTEH